MPVTEFQGLMRALGPGWDSVVFVWLGCAVPFTLLAALRVDGQLGDMSWWHVFAPLFVAAGVSLYLYVIIACRAALGMHSNAKEFCSRLLYPVAVQFVLLVLLALTSDALERNKSLSRVADGLYALAGVLFVRLLVSL